MSDTATNAEQDKLLKPNPETDNPTHEDILKSSKIIFANQEGGHAILEAGEVIYADAKLQEIFAPEGKSLDPTEVELIIGPACRRVKFRRETDKKEPNETDKKEPHFEREFYYPPNTKEKLIKQRWWTVNCPDGVVYTFCTFVDITTEKKAITFDSLTGLLKRDSALEELAKWWPKNNDVFIAFGDANHFKFFNDHFGHEAGDYVLHLYGQAIDEELRPEDIRARWGGDEFLIAVKNCSLTTMQEITDRINEKLKNSRQQIIEYLKTTEMSKNYTVDQLNKILSSVDVGITFGIEQRPAGQLVSLENVIKSADAKMYKIKHPNALEYTKLQIIDPYESGDQISAHFE